jgi:serine protease AprX
MNRLLLFTCSLLLLWGGSAQAQQLYWLQFSDKGPDPEAQLAAPSNLLSPKALARREKLGQSVQFADLPIHRPYLAQLSAAGLNVRQASRWFNAVSVQTTLTLPEIQAICPAVTAMRPVGQLRTTAAQKPVPLSVNSYPLSVRDALENPDQSPTPNPQPPHTATNFDYGTSLDQLAQLNLPCLHQRGYTGRGVLVAQFDSGFLDVDTIDAFDSLWQQNRVVAYRDFVNNDLGVFDEDWHGLAVLSCFAANKPGIYVGASPHVSVMLGRTETVFSETHQEEDNWLAGVEWADSAGADIIQSSLGYYVLDSGQGDYTYADMDGNTTIIAKAADMAAARGILVCNSAGNEGNSGWHYLISPCDGDSVLCVGAVDPTGTHVGFSSYGPSSDGQVKPDVMAMGAQSAVIAFGGTPGNASGTSFSSPQMSGVAACLIQAHPARTNMEIIEALRQSADRYMTPDSAYGYGVPDACKADSILDVLDLLAIRAADLRGFGAGIVLYPTPTQDVLMVDFPSQRFAPEMFVVRDIEGRLVQSMPAQRGSLHHKLAVDQLPAGTYLLEIQLDNGAVTAQKFIRQ